MAKVFPNLMQTMHTMFKETKYKKCEGSYTKKTLHQLAQSTRALEARQQRGKHHYGDKRRQRTEFSETAQERRRWSNIYEVLKRKPTNLEFCTQRKDLSIINEQERPFWRYSPPADCHHETRNGDGGDPQAGGTMSGGNMDPTMKRKKASPGSQAHSSCPDELRLLSYHDRAA